MLFGFPMLLVLKHLFMYYAVNCEKKTNEGKELHKHYTNPTHPRGLSSLGEGAFLPKFQLLPQKIL